MSRKRDDTKPQHEPEVGNRSTPAPAPTKLSRQEAHDLGMIIKDRAKVLKSHAEEQAAAHLADFERQISTTYKFDQDEVWAKLTHEAGKVVLEANKKIVERAKALGIPASFAPAMELNWRNRGQNLMSSRRDELRGAAKSAVEAMKASAMTRIDKQSLDLRTQVVSAGLLSAEGRMFLESLAPVADSMISIDFKKIADDIAADRKKRIANHNAIYGHEPGGYTEIGYDGD